MNRRAFTLLEMLLATALAAVLMAAVLLMLAGVSRDRRRVSAATASPMLQTIEERIRWDIVNAQSMDVGNDGGSVVLTGHGAIDHQSLTSNGRLSQVTYRMTSGCLVREQEYLDNPAQPSRWRALVAVNVHSFRVVAETADATGSSVPSRVRLKLETTNAAIDKELWIK
jgi:prepilin-type N-terminal cleavage/methylation domain-containing protein